VKTFSFEASALDDKPERPMTIHVGQGALSNTSGRKILSAKIDGVVLTIEFPETVAVTTRGEPFLSVALFHAMADGYDLEFEDSLPLDPQLIERLPLIQAVLCLWNPAFKPVQVTCRALAVPAGSVRTLTSFSGGVDSSSTLLSHLSEIEALLTVDCFDSGLHTDAFEALTLKIGATAKRLGKGFIPIRSNAQYVCSELRISWNYVHGPFLCLLAATMGVNRFYIPSSSTYIDLKPWGSHPILDPMWSTSATEVIHDGAHLTRTQKTERIASDPVLLQQLQVCWDSQVRNCGQCSKCARTLLVLNTLGLKDVPFPKIESRYLIKAMGLKNDLGASFVRDLIMFLDRHDQKDLAQKLAKRLRTYRLKTALARARRALLGPGLVAAYRKFADRKKRLERVYVFDPDDGI